MSESFKKFLSTIDKEKLTNTFPNSKELKFSLSNEGLQNYTNEIIGYNFETSIILIEQYHNWLFENYDIKSK